MSGPVKGNDALWLNGVRYVSSVGGATPSSTPKQHGRGQTEERDGLTQRRLIPPGIHHKGKGYRQKV